MEATQIYYFVFGALTIIGGVMGFVKARSKASLIAGGVSGVLLIVAGLLLPENLHVGLTLGLIVSVLLAGRFVPVFIHKKTPVALAMTVLSLLGIVFTLMGWYSKRS
jgi:uncharacterized membrane protein (UPF0136 family)